MRGSAESVEAEALAGLGAAEAVGAVSDDTGAEERAAFSSEKAAGSG